jgi:hypothetical protein
VVSYEIPQLAGLRVPAAFHLREQQFAVDFHLKPPAFGRDQRQFFNFRLKLS